MQKAIYTTVRIDELLSHVQALEGVGVFSCHRFVWFPFFETGLEQPTGRFWQTDRRERTNMHHRVDAITTI